MKKIISLFLAAVMCLGLCACHAATQNSQVAKKEIAPTAAAEETPAPVEETPAPVEDTAAPAADSQPEPESTPALYSDTPVNVMVLNGTTGYGMAKLMAAANAQEASLNYTFSLETDASTVTAALINGSCDIAALPTNAAAAVYNKTGGGVKVAALNTLGVLYLVVNGENLSVSSLADLEGMTVYVPAQNPSFIFQALTDAAGVNVTIDNTYAQPADLRTALAAGEVDAAVLPEPMVTIACAANEKLSVALDLTEEWDAVEPAGSLVQGCVVVRSDFAAENPGELAVFLEEYASSIIYLTMAIDEAAGLVELAGLAPSADIAREAIPNCNVCYIDGAEMKEALNEYLTILFELAPESIGGAVPGDDFYYMG